jgi:hypothetical protein
MKKITLPIFALISCVLYTYAQVNTISTFVRGYFKNKSTYVNGYYRTSANNTINDNSK